MWVSTAGGALQAGSPSASRRRLVARSAPPPSVQPFPGQVAPAMSILHFANCVGYNRFRIVAKHDFHEKTMSRGFFGEGG